MAIFTFAQVLISSLKLCCKVKTFWKLSPDFRQSDTAKLPRISHYQTILKKKIGFWKKWKKWFFGWTFFRSSSVEDDLWKMTWQNCSLPWCLYYLNISFTFTPLSSNCSIYHCCNPWSISSSSSSIMWPSQL